MSALTVGDKVQTGNNVIITMFQLTLGYNRYKTIHSISAHSRRQNTNTMKSSIISQLIFLDTEGCFGLIYKRKVILHLINKIRVFRLFFKI